MIGEFVVSYKALQVPVPVSPPFLQLEVLEYTSNYLNRLQVDQHLAISTTFEAVKIEKCHKIPATTVTLSTPQIALTAPQITTMPPMISLKYWHGCLP